MAQLADFLPGELQQLSMQPAAWQASAWAGPEARAPQRPAPLAHPGTPATLASAFTDGGAAGASAALPATACAPSAGTPVVQCTDWDGWEDASHLLLPPADNLPPATASPPATLPLPIPLGPARKPNNANSPSLDGWHVASDANERISAAVKHATPTQIAVHGTLDAPATPDSSAAEVAELLAAMGIDDGAVATKTAQVVSSGWSSPVGSPPQGSDGWQWGSSCDSSDDGLGGASSAGDVCGASTHLSTQRASRAERAEREAARQASNSAFVRSRQVIGGMKEEAAQAFQRAIDARRQGRLADAVEFERQAKALTLQAKAHRERAARDAYRRNNGAAVNHMPDVNLHELTVPQALNRVRAVVDGAMQMAAGGVYSLVTVAFIPGWGKHSPAGASKILAATQDYLNNMGISYRMDNPGKICALISADAY